MMGPRDDRSGTERVGHGPANEPFSQWDKAGLALAEFVEDRCLENGTKRGVPNERQFG